MKRISLSILLTLILTVGAFARTVNMSASQVLQFEAEVGQSVKILEDSFKGHTKMNSAETRRALQTVYRACEFIAAEGSPEEKAFAKDCTGYINAYHLSNKLVISECYVLKPEEPKAPAPKAPPKTTTNTFGDDGLGFSDSLGFSYEVPFEDYSDPTLGYSIGFGIYDECAESRKDQEKALKEMNTCISGGDSTLKKLGDFLGCALGVFIGRPCKTT